MHYKVPGSVIDNYRRWCWNNVVAHGVTFVNEIIQAQIAIGDK